MIPPMKRGLHHEVHDAGETQLLIHGTGAAHVTIEGVQVYALGLSIHCRYTLPAQEVASSIYDGPEGLEERPPRRVGIVGREYQHHARHHRRNHAGRHQQRLQPGRLHRYLRLRWDGAQRRCTVAIT
jgi:hypothetical protein